MTANDGLYWRRQRLELAMLNQYNCSIVFPKFNLSTFALLLLIHCCTLFLGSFKIFLKFLLKKFAKSK